MSWDCRRASRCLLAGSTIVAASVAVTLWTNLGPGPLDVFIGAVRVHTGLPLSFAVWLVVGMLIAVAWLLGRRPGVGTIVGPVVVGVVMQSVSALLADHEAPTSIVVRVVIHLLAIGAVGIGAGALIVSGLGAGSGELLASAASNRSGRTEPRVPTGVRGHLARDRCGDGWTGRARHDPRGPDDRLVGVERPPHGRPDGGARLSAGREPLDRPRYVAHSAGRVA